MANEVTITVKGREQGAKKTVDDVRSSVQRVGEVAQGIIAAQLFQQIGQQAQQFLGNAKVAASDLGESVNAMGVVFKGATPALLEIGKTASTSMGLSQRAFNDASVRFSSFAKTVAGDGGDVSTVIRDITQRSSDFASVMNLDVEQAMQVFQSGLAGESEPLRRYGIDVSAAAVQTFAYAEGIAEAGSELTEAQKIQARYGIIMQQTNEMAGDFANTSDSLANQQRILNAEWENSQAVMGQAVVPAFQLLNAVLIPVLQTFQELPGPVQTVISVLILLGAGILTVTSRIAPMIISMNAAGISAGTMSTKFRALALSAASLGIAVAAAGVGIIAWGTSARHVQGDVQGLTEDIEHLTNTGESTAQLKSMFGEGAAGAEEFKDKLDVATAGFFDWSDSLNRSFDEISRAKSAFEDLDASMAAMVDQGADADELMESLAEEYGLTTEQVEKLKGALPEYTEAAERAAAATGKEGDAHSNTTGEIEDHIGALDTLATKLKEQTDPLFAVVSAQQKLKEVQDDSEASSLDLAEAELDLFNALQVASDGMDGSLIPSLRRARDAGILSEEAFDALVDVIKEVDRTDANIRVKDNTAQAKRRFDNLRARLKNIDRFITYSFQTRGAAPVGSFNVANAHGGISGGPRRMQDGGISGDGFSQLEVNERGQELARIPSGDIVSLPLGSTVIPAGQSQAMLKEARHTLDRLQSGGSIFEDFSFKGAGGQFNDQFADMYSGSLNRRDMTRFMENMVQQLEDSLMSAISPSNTGNRLMLEVRYIGSGDAVIDEIVKRLSFKVREEAGGSVDQLLGGT